MLGYMLLSFFFFFLNHIYEDTFVALNLFPTEDGEVLPYIKLLSLRGISSFLVRIKTFTGFNTQD